MNGDKELESIILASKLHPYPGKKCVLKIDIDKPSYSEKVSCAAHVSTMGIHHTGIGTQAKLMWPLKQWNEGDVELMAARILACALTALLQALPPREIDTIWKLQDEYLSFVAEPQSPSAA